MDSYLPPFVERSVTQRVSYLNPGLRRIASDGSLTDVQPWSHRCRQFGTVFLGIAKPDIVLRSLSERGLRIERTVIRADHALFTDEDMQLGDSSDFLVTTEKDFLSAKRLLFAFTTKSICPRLDR